jgi:hypothetical protein
MKPLVFLLLLSLGWPQQTRGQATPAPPGSPPQRAESPATRFAVERLTTPPAIASPEWVPLRPSFAGTIRAPNDGFSIVLEEAPSNADLVLLRVSYVQGDAAPIEISPGDATYSLITPDSRWILSGPLEFVDVQNWRAYSLRDAFDLQPFLIPRAVSTDGRRFLIEGRPCPFDCQDLPTEYYEIVLQDVPSLGSCSRPVEDTYRAMTSSCDLGVALERLTLRPDRASPGHGPG